MKRLIFYHLLAFVTVSIWGVTFVSTKILISNGLTPVNIFIFRFALAYLCALAFSYDKLLADSSKDEFLLFCAGITGGSLYFICENSALGLTFASNVSLIICCAPIYTMLLGKTLFKDRISSIAWMGSATAFLGVGLVVFNGAFNYNLNPMGDFLTLIAALSCSILYVAEKAKFNLFKYVYKPQGLFLRVIDSYVVGYTKQFFIIRVSRMAINGCNRKFAVSRCWCFLSMLPNVEWSRQDFRCRKDRQLHLPCTSNYYSCVCYHNIRTNICHNDYRNCIDCWRCLSFNEIISYFKLEMNI